MIRFLILSLILVLLVSVNLSLFHSHFAKGQSVAHCPLTYSQLERSLVINTPKSHRKDIPNDLVFEYLKADCLNNQLANQIITNEATITELLQAHRNFLIISDQVGEYLYLYKRPRIPQPHDVYQWLILAQTNDTGGNLKISGDIYTLSGHHFSIKKRCLDQSWQDCQLLSIIQYQEMGMHVRRRTFNHCALLITQWEPVSS